MPKLFGPDGQEVMCGPGQFDILSKAKGYTTDKPAPAKVNPAAKAESLDVEKDPVADTVEKAKSGKK